MVRALQWLLLVASFVGMVACGYHLSGTRTGEAQHFPQVLKRLSIEGLNRYDPLYPVLVSTLHGYGFRVLGGRGATAQLQFSNKKEVQRIHAIGVDAKASEILLRISFDVRIVRKDGQLLLPQQTIQSEAYYLNNPNQVLETEILRKNAVQKIEVDLVARLLNRMASIRIRQARQGKGQQVREKQL